MGGWEENLIQQTLNVDWGSDVTWRELGNVVKVTRMTQRNWKEDPATSLEGEKGECG